MLFHKHLPFVVGPRCWCLTSATNCHYPPCYSAYSNSSANPIVKPLCVSVATNTALCLPALLPTLPVLHPISCCYCSNWELIFNLCICPLIFWLQLALLCLLSIWLRLIVSAPLSIWLQLAMHCLSRTVCTLLKSRSFFYWILWTLVAKVMIQEETPVRCCPPWTIPALATLKHYSPPPSRGIAAINANSSNLEVNSSFFIDAVVCCCPFLSFFLFGHWVT